MLGNLSHFVGYVLQGEGGYGGRGGGGVYCIEKRERERKKRYTVLGS